MSASNPQFLRDPFPGNIIPADRINPVGRNVASIYPLPNAPGNFDNYTSTVNRVVDENVFSGRVDHAGIRQGLVLRPLQLGQFKLDAPPGPGGVLPADAGGSRGHGSSSGRTSPASRTRA